MTQEEKIDFYILTAIKAIIMVGCLVALIILIDYLLPGFVVNEPVEWKKVELTSRRQSRNYAYLIYTPERSFYCEKDFFVGLNLTDTVTLHLSPWFSAVNSYAFTKSMAEPQTFSLRFAAGFILPLV